MGIFTNQTSITCHVASWHLKRIIPAFGKKLSSAAISRAIKAGIPLEFLDAVTGQCFTISEVKENMPTVKSLTVRYNGDRDFAVVRI